jgi:hypothetical protein
VRRILRLLGSRYGLAVVGVVLIVAIVGVARVASEPRPLEELGPPQTIPPAVSSIDQLGDDSVATSEGPPTVASIPGVATPDVVALSFAQAWLMNKGVISTQWVKGLKPFSTERLLNQFKDVDPASVPAESIRGSATVRPRDSQLAEVDIPVTPGVLKLRVVVSDGRWLVDGVSWERS